AFGEFVEHHDDTPRLTAAEVAAKRAEGADMVILDSRPMGEYRAMNIPGGIPNRVVALKDGTMGWHLAGLELERGQTRHAAAPSAEGRAKAMASAGRVAARFGVRRIDRAALDRFAAEREGRSLYLLDVRTPEEFAASHLPGARLAPGGQLV